MTPARHPVPPLRAPAAGRPLGEWCPGVPPELAGLRAKGISYDSRKVGRGDLFFALRGARSDGASFLVEAARRGAVAAVADAMPADAPAGLPVWTVGNPREFMGVAADAFWGRPSRALQLLGVTGTNGKTTTAWLFRDWANAVDMPCGLVGTVEYDLLSRRLPASRTMPEAPDTHAFLAEMLANGAQTAAMEVSSQGLAARRDAGLHFSAAIFTNLTGDHLDFHGTMEAYFAEKRRLFVEAAGDAPAIVNIADAYGRRLAADPALAGRVVSFGVDVEAADWRAIVRESTADGTRFDLRSPKGRCDGLWLPLPGRYNLENALGALAALSLFGVELPLALEKMASLRGAPGRLERIPDPRGKRRCFVDYAHTDDALKNVLTCLRGLPGRGRPARGKNARIVCVFGCGGDRDRTKRPRMGAVAAELADAVVLTNDNPRSEDPSAILSEILAGVPAADRPKFAVEPDRAAAIALALAMAKPGDVVLVAGKGHESGQETAGIVRPFDDRLALAEALAK